MLEDNEFLNELGIEDWSDEQMREVSDYLLSALSLNGDVDVEKELSIHYAKTKMVYDKLLTMVQEGVVPQGMATMASSITKILKDTADLRASIRTARDYQKLEAAIITIFEDLPQDVGLDAVAELRRILGGEE